MMKPELYFLARRNTIMLHIKAGSDEADFLSAFCPIAQTPALVVIDNGRVCLHIEMKVGQEEFWTRFKDCIS